MNYKQCNIYKQRLYLQERIHIRRVTIHHVEHKVRGRIGVWVAICDVLRLHIFQHVAFLYFRCKESFTQFLQYSSIWHLNIQVTAV